MDGKLAKKKFFTDILKRYSDGKYLSFTLFLSPGLLLILLGFLDKKHYSMTLPDSLRLLECDGAMTIIFLL